MEKGGFKVEAGLGNVLFVALLNTPSIKKLRSGSEQHCALIFGTKVIAGVPECAFFY